MQSVKCGLSLLLVFGICQMYLAMPSVVRVKRQDGLYTLEDAEGNLESNLNPLQVEDNVSTDELERNKRKLPEATFEAKNAVLGFVFGKVDNFLDTKTRVLEQLDRSNVEKNKQWDIQSPVPIKDFQTLITAVVSPKIRSLGNIANDITTGVLTTITAFSGSSSGGGAANANAGLGNVVSKFLGFSGPILQGASGGAGGGASGTTAAPDSDEAGY